MKRLVAGGLVAEQPVQALKLGDGNLVATISGLELNMGTMTVQDASTTLTDAHILSLTGTATVFVGTGGDLNEAHDTVVNGTFGFSSGSVGISLVMATTIAGDTYVGAIVSVSVAQLIGVSGLQLYATATVRYNQAADVNGDPIATRIDWSVATTTNDPENILVDLDITDAVILQLEGSAAIDVGSGMLVAVLDNVVVNMGTMTVTDGVTTLTNADFLSVSGTGDAFVGQGGSLNGAHDAVVDGTLGFAATGLSIKFVTATGAMDDGDNAGDTYTGAEIAIDSAQLIGVDALQFSASGMVIINNVYDALGGALALRMNWSSATTG